jgi:Putative DnaT-like ssDNA binding protein
MAFVVEDGTGVTGATSYCSEDDFDTYTEDRGYAVVVGDTEQALVRATQCLDGIYRLQFSGTKTHGRSQSLEWPRTDATDAEGLTLATNEIPIEIIEATCELALRELAAPNSILPDLERGGGIQSLRAGSVAITYTNAAATTTTLQLINGILSSLIGGSARTGTAFGQTMRG